MNLDNFKPGTLVTPKKVDETMEDAYTVGKTYEVLCDGCVNRDDGKFGTGLFCEWEEVAKKEKLFLVYQNGTKNLWGVFPESEWEGALEKLKEGYTIKVLEGVPREPELEYKEVCTQKLCGLK